ncbi:hypothetical protein [Sulfitobacter sp. S190]|uniref:hypothetical protein n=1 Tax=Sulfitobacter sp. S190 TaxID=2867022 RepID=UPI0021A5AE80|nr:hypothetical protein [Sulfitobacter sp. S190]UWR20973.1 hypothetical protein K3756_09575 [Sulfitobacter sp. S190]
MQDWAVFTGDIVKSTAMSPDALDAVFAALARAAAQIGKWQGTTVPFARFRGDGWQMAVDPKYALRGALLVRALVRATGKNHDTRIGIGIGAGTVTEGDVTAADGPAFVASGHALDTMNRHAHLSAPGANAPLRAAAPLADRIAQGWTPKQAEVAAALLAPSPPTQTALAEQLGRSRQMVQKQAEGAALSDLIEACEVVEAQ